MSINNHDMRDKFTSLTKVQKDALPRIVNNNGRDYASCPNCKHYHAMMPEFDYASGERFNYCRDCGTLGYVTQPTGETK
jgi:hypothetical protein